MLKSNPRSRASKQIRENKKLIVLVKPKPYPIGYINFDAVRNEIKWRERFIKKINYKSNYAKKKINDAFRLFFNRVEREHKTRSKSKDLQYHAALKYKRKKDGFASFFRRVEKEIILTA